MNIENITEEEYLSILPKYQREIVNQLINSYGIERAVDKWIESNGPQNNVQFGGDGDGSLLSKIKDTIKIEINKFICGYSSLDKVDALEYSTGTKTLQLCIVGSISNYIAELLSISVVSITPVVVMLFIAAKKIGLNTYCEVVGFPRNKK